MQHNTRAPISLYRCATESMVLWCPYNSLQREPPFGFDSWLTTDGFPLLEAVPLMKFAYLTTPSRDPRVLVRQRSRHMTSATTTPYTAQERSADLRRLQTHILTKDLNSTTKKSSVPAHLGQAELSTYDNRSLILTHGSRGVLRLATYVAFV